MTDESRIDPCGVYWTAAMAFLPSFLVIGGGLMAGRGYIEAELSALVEAFAHAELHGDIEFLDRLLVSDFMAVGPQGFLLSREQWLDRHRSGELKHRSCIWDDIHIRAYGGAAVVIARQIMDGRHQGRDIQGVFRGSLLFLKIDERWRIASLQLSPTGEGSGAF